MDRELLLRVGRFVRPYSWRILGMLLLLLLVSLLELIPPLLYGELINELVPEEGGEPTLTLQRLNFLAAGLLGAPLLSNLIGVGQRWMSARIGEGLIYELRVRAYRHVQRLGLRFFTETKAGDIISRFNNDVIGAQNAVTNTIPNLVANLLTLVTTLAVMIALEWRLTLLAVAVLPLFLLPTRRVGRILRDIRRKAAGYDAKMSSQLQETVNVSGALLVRTYGQQGPAVDKFADAAASVRDIGVRRAIIGRLFFMGLGIAGAIGTAMMYWAGGYMAAFDNLQPGIIVTFAAYLSRLYGPLSALSNVQVEFATSLVSFERIFEYLDLPVEIDEKPDAVALDTVEGRVAFEDVWFTYRRPERLGPPLGTRNQDGGTESPEPGDGHDLGDDTPHPTNARAVADASDDGPSPNGEGANLEWALRSIDVTIEPGSVVALVGPSGAGKSTLSYLVARLYDPTEGRVTLDGHDLRDLTLGTLARHIGMVTQETYLFHESIRSNLEFVRPGASQAEIEAACRAANIHDHIAGLPDGYDTVVGERGYRLSGGEKQRLAIARVILKDPSILVLDEATSHLDSQNEALVQQALGRVMHGRTNLVIAHRLSTVRSADQILVLQDGAIIERGSHDELIGQEGLYADLYETQFREPEAQVLA